MKSTNSGHRLQLAILMSRMTFKEFGEKYNISVSNMYAWRNEKVLLSGKGAERVVQGLQKEGVFCTVEWLLYNEGISPRFANQTDHSEGLLTFTTNQTASQELNITKEVEYFKKLNDHSVVIFVNDDAMIPAYNPGEYVGGIFLEKDQYKHADGSICIVKLTNSKIFLRKVSKTENKELFNLYSINLHTKTEEPFIKNAKVTGLAPVIWWRKAPFYVNTDKDSS